MLSVMEVVVAIKRCPLFSSVHGEALKRLADGTREKVVTAGEVVFDENDLGEELYLVHQGAVSLFRVSGNEEVEGEVVRPGGYFGEQALIDELPRSTSARAVEAGLLLVLDRRNFRAAIQDYPDIALEMMQELSLRLRAAEARIRALVDERRASRAS
jgi:CRP-like cAMP-binding protein